MARVRLPEIIDHLSQPVRAALDDTLARTAPDAGIDRAQFYREFRRAGGAIKPWERVPDSTVDGE